MSVKTKEVNSGNFKEEVIASGVPVVVDFWAEWCMPCRMISPTIDELSEHYKGKMKFVKVNVDNNPELATELQVLSIPVLVVFKSGKEVTRIVGANPKEHIQKEVESALR